MKVMAMAVSIILAGSQAYSVDESFSGAMRDELNSEINSLYRVQAKKKTKSVLLAQNTSNESSTLDAKSNNELVQDSAPKAEPRINDSSTQVLESNSISSADAKTGDSKSGASLQGITINATSTVQPQPTTVVQDSPLHQSKLNQIKKSREEIEKSNEERLIEKIEQDRIESERKRTEKADKVFDSSSKETTNNNVVVVEQAPVTTQRVLIEDSLAEDQIVADYKNQDVTPVEEESQFYVSALGGMADYNAGNVKGVYAAGLGLGMIFPEGLIAEASFLFSSYDIKLGNSMYLYGPASDIEMDQRNVSGAVKYQLLQNSRVKPHVGALLSYTQRVFKYKYYPTVSIPNSNAFDAGLLVGADIGLSKNFSLGADFRYMMNLSYRRDEGQYPYYYGYYYQPSTPFSTPIEELNYYTFTINGTFKF